ncbi:hypothetical protein L218DRAFT_1009341 [Marasmius fiardii PR-910]|nr:hypothetical protein L218DRAFT_1009341 [Marasmius fiardii PR-910]
MPVFNSVAKEVDKVRTRGRSKDWEVLVTTFSSHLVFRQYLCPNWKARCDIDMKSGLGGYDVRTGAHVAPETVSVWEDLVKMNPLVKPYRNAG